ncbi:MAG: hypothetical protein HY914_22665 [Desulfomonile tiedjei]|nr:hypothetical protein [Desulfomonile tiedjei]
MKHLMHGVGLKYVCFPGLVLATLAMLTGCEEVNVAVDSVLGIESPVLSATVPRSPLSAVPATNRNPEAQPFSVAQAPAPSPQQRPTTAAPPQPRQETAQVEMPGKKREPGEVSPETSQKVAEQRPKEAVFIMGRDPFEQPTEILPSECPPSMPLCRFDRSQLKLVGIIQVKEGDYKGMVEDPDGRGYFITAGMQIGGGTVTQITSKSVVIHLHRTRQDVQLPLFTEARAETEF